MNNNEGHFFCVTKPLQLMVALAIVEQLPRGASPRFVVVDSFANAISIVKRFQDFFDIPVEFVADVGAAVKLMASSSEKMVYIDSDVGVRKFFQLARIKFSSREKIIGVYEEGIGTYRDNIYKGIKRKLFDFLGVGTNFGGCRFVSKTYVFECAHYERIFGNGKAVGIKFGIAEMIERKRDLYRVFGADESLFAELSCAEVCHLYLSSWSVSNKFIEKLLDFDGFKYVKLHPHIKVDCNFGGCFRKIPAEIPAEIVVIELARRCKKLHVWHHGSSVQNYVRGNNIDFHVV